MTILYDQTMRGLQRSLHCSLITSELDFDHAVMHVDGGEKQLRCGILHQAEAKENARLLIRADVPLAATRDDGTGLTINRRLYH